MNRFTVNLWIWCVCTQKAPDRLWNPTWTLLTDLLEICFWCFFCSSFFCRWSWDYMHGTTSISLLVCFCQNWSIKNPLQICCFRAGKLLISVSFLTVWNLYQFRVHVVHMKKISADEDLLAYENIKRGDSKGIRRECEVVADRRRLGAELPRRKEQL